MWNEAFPPKLCVMSDCAGVKHPPKALLPTLRKTQLVKNPVTSGKDIFILIFHYKFNFPGDRADCI